MKLNKHSKTQITGTVLLVVAFFVTVLYSKGYFDLTFVDRPGGVSKPDQTTRVEYTRDDYKEETTNQDDSFFDDRFEEFYDEFLQNQEQNNSVPTPEQPQE